MKYALTFYLISCFSFLSANTFTFRNYQMENGLSQNSVWSVMQDNDGFMWFGTKDGLNRFDGINFKIYRKIHGDSTSIGSNFIRAIKEDSKGRFWIGTEQGLYIMDKKTDRFVKIKVKLSENFNSDLTINSIFEDKRGNIWFATHGQGILVFSDEENNYKHYYYNPNEYNSLPSNFIWSLAQDSNDMMWIGTVGAGIVRFDYENEQFTLDIIKKDFLPDLTIYGIFCDKNNNIWIGTSSKGLYCYNYRSGKTTRLLDEENPELLNIRAISEYSDNEIIMGSDNGLIILNMKSHTYKIINNNTSSNNLSDKSVFCITKDREGSFWLGTYFGGVNYYSPSMNQFSYYCYTPNRNSLNGNIVSGFSETEDGLIYISTNDGGLSQFNPRNGSFKNYSSSLNPKIKYHNIQTLLLVKHNLWMGFYSKGINILNIKNNQITNFVHDPANINSLNDDNIYSLYETSKGEVLVGTPIGVNKYNDSNKTFTSIEELNNIYIKDIKEDYQGNIWFATNSHGMYKFSKNGEWTNYINNSTDPNSISNNNINCLFFDFKKRLWIGTEGGGICIFNSKQENFTLLNEKKGLPNNMVYAIIDDVDGNLWVSTNSGLAKINIESFEINSFSHIEGLKKIRFNYKCAFRTINNSLYFGGTNGFTVFNPREFNDISTVEPIIAITGFHVFNKEIESGSKILKHNINYTNSIELKHNESTFSFDFAALSYLSPENNQFEFILDGFEKEWKKTNTIQKAYYMNIPPGKYVFRIRACNSYQIWNQGERSISIRIKPPFWFSNLMLIIYFFTIITIGWYIIYKNNRRLEKNNLLKLEKYKTIKELETYESKINFFTNIAHEIRTPLSLIIAPLEKILKTCNISSETRLFLGIIEQNTNRLLELVNQLLDYRKMEEGELYLDIRHQDIIPVVRKAYNLYVHNAELKNVSMTFNTTHDSIMCTFDAEAICKILSNLISNAVKYAQSRISLTVYLKNNQLHLEIEDDGIGIDNKLIDKIFEPFFQIENEVNKTKAGSGLGLAFAQSLAVKHDGLIRVFSKGSRTIFTLILPLSDADSSCIESQNKSNEETENLNFIDSNDTNKPKILIVEDNIELRTFLCQNLNANFISKEAENGEFAIRLLEKESFDVIISDIMMPKMDGIEFCRYVKSNPIYSHLPFIILSAKAEISSKVQGLEIGADVYIEKPFSIDFLSAQIASIIENRNRIREKFINTPLVYLKQSQTEGIESVFIQKLNEAIIENIANKDFNIDSLAKIFLMSRSNFHKKIKTITGMTPNDYINLIRLNKAALILSSKKYKINEVCYMVGFNTPSYFTKCFYDKFGKLPKDYIAKP